MHFVIAGRVTCPQFTFAIMVAQRLSENLPDFTYLQITKKPEHWEKWLVQLCRENNWHHLKSPIIWREIGLKKGKKEFIGDVNKFLDMCYDYYGIPADVLSAEHFTKDEMNWFTKRTEAEFFEDIKEKAQERKMYRSRQVCITGASSPITEVVIMELLQIDLQMRENGLEIRLFDEPKKKCSIMDMANDAKNCPGPSGLGNCRVVTNLKEAFSNVDLVIVLDSFPRKANESLIKWLKRNRNAMCGLGKALDMFAPTHCRVIIGSPSNEPICYNATVLASFATRLHVRNIVAVTQDLGREALKSMALNTETPIRDFYCPPVWGFIGLNKFVDIRRTLHTNVYKIPGKRENTTLPQGSEEYELRTSEYLIDRKCTNKIHAAVAQCKGQVFSQLRRWPSLPKATAIIDLLKVWGIKQEDGNGEILCLGVYSDGAFRIPRGLYWSQPVILSDGFWVPFREFPIPRSPYFDMYYLFVFSMAAVYRTKVKPRIYIPPKKVKKPKEKKKFDFDKMAEQVGMPVIRTETECVVYLKYLTKKELGINLDLAFETIEEEDEPEILPTEEVIEEPVFCECWRQELKELQKVVFDRSSTTEIEVDLTDNVSSSEWSVINLPLEANPEGSSEEKIDPFYDGGTHGKFSFDSNASTVCSCEKLSTGSVCQCLGPPKDEAPPEEEKISTEHFYKEQNAEVFEDDLKDVIYEDTYTQGKHVTFDSEAKEEDDTGFRMKFYGKADAVRDEKADLKMRKRILKYEQSGEDSVEEERSISKEKEESLQGELAELGEQGSGDETKFKMSGEGPCSDIEGDQSGLECLDGMKGKGRSETSFKEIYEDEITPSINIIPVNSEKSIESSDSYNFGEGYMKYKGFSEFSGEGSFSMESFQQDLDAIWGEGGPYMADQDDYGFEKARKRRREGVPVCGMCRCLVPEGIPCCPCGANTVVEVFKKESIEVLIQCEDDIDYVVEYFEALRTESKISLPIPDDEDDTPEKKGLPPESFLPFFPKPQNVFKQAVRPFELTKDYIDSFNDRPKEIPPKCTKFMAEAMEKLKEMQADRGEGEEDVEEDEEKENLPPICEEIEQIKTDFSDLKLFIPCGLEDWRLTVQKKYREWFFQGPKIQDESYYDFAVEEVSEDEFEVDKELDKFFEM